MAKKETVKKKSAEGASSIDALEKLKSFYSFMKENGLEALELEEKDFSLRLIRRKNPVSRPVPVPVPVSTSVAVATPVAVPAPSAVATEAVPSGIKIKAPMMGIFYRAPTPSSPPFAREGEAVKPGHVLCMIEAMKVFNETRAEFPCVIVKVLVENGKSVKAGQDLFIVERQ